MKLLKYHKISLIILLNLGVLLGTTLSAAPVRPSSPPLSLKAAIHFALEHSPVLDTASKTQTIRELEYKTAISKILPSVDLAATHGFQNNVMLDNILLAQNPTAPWYSSVSLGLTETLYDNGVSLNKLDVADLNRALARLNFHKVRDSLVLDIIIGFYQYSLAEALLEVRKQNQDIVGKQFRTMTDEYEQGFKVKSDFLRLKAQVQHAEIDRITAENAVILAATELRKLLGVDVLNPEPIAFEPMLVKFKAVEMNFPEQPLSFEKLYDFKIAEIEKNINKRSVDLAVRNYWPSVSVSSSVAYSNQGYLNSAQPFSANGQVSWNALLSVQYNLLDWGSRSRDVEIARYNEAIQENSLTTNLLDTRSKLTELMTNLVRASKNFKLNLELMELEDRSYRDLEIQYREGKLSYLDLITGLNSLLDTKVRFCTVYFEALQDIARYRYFEGRIYETLD